MKLPSLAKANITQAGFLYLALSVGLTALVYASVQQVLRQGANDPQIQLAEDTAAALGQGQTPAVLNAPEVNMRTSLAPYVIVIDNHKTVVAATGKLDGKVVLPPDGVFEAARTNTGKDTSQPHQNRVTWQPAPGVRQAAVVVAYDHGYVVAARSLREVEIRATQVHTYATAVLAALLVIGILALIIIK